MSSRRINLTGRNCLIVFDDGSVSVQGVYFMTTPHRDGGLVSDAYGAKFTPGLWRDVISVPMRGTPVEEWLKAKRDEFPEHDVRHVTIDDLLDEYRLRADTGHRLNERISDD